MHNPSIVDAALLKKASIADHKQAAQINKTLPLKVYIEEPLQAYLLSSGDQAITGLYQTVLSEVESTLLRVILKYCKSQTKASKILGLNRGTLQKKLKKYQLMKS